MVEEDRILKVSWALSLSTMISYKHNYETMRTVQSTTHRVYIQKADIEPNGSPIITS